MRHNMGAYHIHGAAEPRKDMETLDMVHFPGRTGVQLRTDVGRSDTRDNPFVVEQEEVAGSRLVLQVICAGSLVIQEQSPVSVDSLQPSEESVARAPPSVGTLVCSSDQKTIHKLRYLVTV